MLYAIADLHLDNGLKQKKPMSIFGPNWDNHQAKIAEYWLNTVSEDDTVLLPGDISWAMSDEEFEIDMAFLSGLPGKKIIISGNHDYWWSSASKLNDKYKDAYFLKNSYYKYGDIHICGSRGWVAPGCREFTKHDLKIYKRELLRMELSLKAAMKDGAAEILVMMHFPPFDDSLSPTGFVDIFRKFPVKQVVYGHLHGNHTRAVNEIRDGIKYRLTASDFLNFKPLRIDT